MFIVSKGSPLHNHIWHVSSYTYSGHIYWVLGLLHFVLASLAGSTTMWVECAGALRLQSDLANAWCYCKMSCWKMLAYNCQLSWAVLWAVCIQGVSFNFASCGLWSTGLRLMIAASHTIDWIALGQTFCMDSLVVKSVLARINYISWFLHLQTLWLTPKVLL